MVEVTEAMIDQKARGIADAVCNNWEIKHRGQEFSMSTEAARLGIIEGLEMAERRAKQLELEYEQSAEKGGYADHRQQNWNYATGARLVANAIRALLEESKG